MRHNGKSMTRQQSLVQTAAAPRAVGRWASEEQDYCRKSLLHDTLGAMKYNLQPLEAAGALLVAPSVAFGIEGHPDVAILDIKSQTENWGLDLDSVVKGCLVLGFNRIILNLADAAVSSSFVIACIASAWHNLVENRGTLVLCMKESARKGFQELTETTLFNIYEETDACVDWLDSEFPREIRNNFPRGAKCAECGAIGQVGRRGDHVCAECGTTYLVTERGELRF
jgi:hypothetical protein